MPAVRNANKFACTRKQLRLPERQRPRVGRSPATVPRLLTASCVLRYAPLQHRKERECPSVFFRSDLVLAADSHRDRLPAPPELCRRTPRVHGPRGWASSFRQLRRLRGRLLSLQGCADLLRASVGATRVGATTFLPASKEKTRHEGKARGRFDSGDVERATGFEPATPSLGSLCSTN